MGSKRKPFIISKAVSGAVVRSGEENDWTAYQVVEIWTLASIHLPEETIGAVFDEVLRRSGPIALFDRRHYKVTGCEAPILDQPLGRACNLISILSEKVRFLIKKKWPLANSAGAGCQWHDFSDSLLLALMKKNVVPNHLKGKKLEQDLGL
ncbi:MAG: hypothetical protein JJK56_08240 [Pseudomonas sp.]|uniref:hypothetical protein n=1 Tax=Pseudomonas sp. TaxID=306 RepID=UPI001A62EF83|nr:hypothetical protein [Pseudomonas sp.]MBL7227974.1 hypothetical protein [Pseudomonas sp.]